MGQLVFQANAGGQTALVGPNPSTSISINIPATNGNMVTTGDSGTVTSTMLASSVYTAPGAIGSGTPNTGAFTTLSASSTVSGTGFSTYLASPPAIGGTTPSTGAFTTVTANRMVDSLGGSVAPISSVMRNRIINGAMVIDQRNAGASINPGSGIPAFAVDRFTCYQEVTSKLTFQRNAGAVTPPDGFTNYLGATSTSTHTLTAGQIFGIYQPIEGFNVADLGWGTANAKTVTLSFWVRSSLTGTFGGALKNSAGNRSYPYSYTINSANTWEQKSVTITGDTTGTWLTTNGIGITVSWGLGVGSTFSGTAGAWAGSNFFSATGATSVVGTDGATFYITGVQLEVGTQATSFEYRQYGTELALCQRYCNVYGENLFSVFGSMGFGFSSTGFVSATLLPVEMRAVPTVSYTGNTRAVAGGETFAVTSATFNTSNSTKKIAVVEPSVASGITTNRGYYWSADNDASARVIFSAEL